MSRTPSLRARPSASRKTVRAYHHGALREDLIAATRKIVEREGADHFTLREGARQAGVSHSAPAHHFGGKAGLLTEIAAQSFDERVALAEARMAAAGPLPGARLKALGMACIEYCVTHPRLHELSCRTNLIDRDAPRFKLASNRLSQLLIAAMADATGAALIPDKEANASTLLAFAVVHGFAALVNEHIILRDAPDAARAGEAMRLADGMLELLRNAFAPASAVS